MKPVLRIAFLSLFIVACSSSDDSSGDGTQPVEGDFFPSALNDEWNYNVESSSTTTTQANFSETDNVVINTVTNNSYTTEVNSGSPAFGTSNSILGSGTFTKSASTLVFDGDLALLQDNDLLPTSDIALQDFVLYDLNAENNAQLYNNDGSFTEEIDAGGLTVPLTITYNVSNTKKEDLSELTVNGVSYTNVIQTEVKFNLSVVGTFTIFGNETSQPILNPQDVLVIKHYFAKDVGLIKSEARQSFNLNPTFIALLSTLGGGGANIPASTIIDNVQELDTYTLN